MATVSHTPPTETRAETLGPFQLAGQFTAGIVLLVVIGLLGWIVFGSLNHFESVDAKRADERRKILADRQSEDYKYLHDQPAWFSKDKKLVRVPIEEAMRMTLPALQANKPHAAYPIATPAADSGAPTSPAKGAGSVPGQNTNPAASNPTTGHPEPAPAAGPTPAPPPAADAGGAPGAPVAPPIPAASATPGNTTNEPGATPAGLR